MRGYKYSILFFASLSFFALFSCKDSIHLPDVSSYDDCDTARCLTFAYMIAENSLSPYARADINEMIQGAADIPDDCKMVLFVDDITLPRICHIYNDGKETRCDTVKVFSKDFCSSDISRMQEVVDWVLTRYPAHSMNLIMWSHANGWLRGRNAPANRSVGIDNEKNNYSNNETTVIEMEELSALLEALPVKVKLLMFDACFMQAAEVAYELRNSAEWIVASPAEIPADGAYYKTMMAPLFTSPLDVEAVIQAYYDHYKDDRNGVVLSAVKCSAMQEFANCTAAYIPKFFSRAVATATDGIFSYLLGGYIVGTSAFYPQYIDANALMYNVLPYDEYLVWRKALDEAVPYKAASDSWYSAPHRRTYTVDHELYSGLSMYLPTENAYYSLFNNHFSTTAWYKAVGWDTAGW